jgi:hypothetical protein
MTGKSSRVVARGASMLRKKCQSFLPGEQELVLLPDLGRGGSWSAAGKFATEPAAVCPAVVVCGARYPR